MLFQCYYYMPSQVSCCASVSLSHTPPLSQANANGGLFHIILHTYNHTLSPLSLVSLSLSHFFSFLFSRQFVLMPQQSATNISLKNSIQRIAGAILSGKELNDPPRTRIKYLCSICNKNCLSNQSCIQCDACDKWCHIKCDGTSIKTYNNLSY